MRCDRCHKLGLQLHPIENLRLCFNCIKLIVIEWGVKLGVAA